MGRPEYSECKDCRVSGPDPNYNGLCEDCSKARRVAAASAAGSAGTGDSKSRANAVCKEAAEKSAKIRRNGTEAGLRSRKEVFVQLCKAPLLHKGLSSNIKEFVQFKKFCASAQRLSEEELSQAFLLGRGIRGQDGIAFAYKWWPGSIAIG